MSNIVTFIGTLIGLYLAAMALNAAFNRTVAAGRAIGLGK